jgi:LuxR family transcriptional regulator
MLSWKEIVQDYIIKYSNQIKKTTQPLRDHFGISYFTYHQIDNAGKYTVLVDRPDWAEHYVSEKIFLNDPYLRHFKVYGSGLCLMENNGSEEYRKTIVREGKALLNMDMGVILIQKQENLVEFFGFAGDKKTSSLNSLYSNHPQLLHSFAVHFKKEMNAVLTDMAKEANSLLELKGPDFLCSVPIEPKIGSHTRRAFLKDLGLKKEAGQAELLTPRERECLRWLLEEKSAKETAALLGLSPRTIESYFENIKGKFSCWSKQEVLNIARNLQDAGLLP